MPAARILKDLCVEYFGSYCDSGVFRVIVRSKTRPTVEELIALGLEPYRCGCAHDCCGHYQYSAPRVERRNKRNEWYVTQHFYRNV